MANEDINYTGPDHTAHIARSQAYTHYPLGEDGARTGMTEEYVFSKINLSLLAELESYVRGEPLDAIYPRLEGKPQNVQQMMIESAMALGDKRRIGTSEFDKAVKSLDGMTFLLYLSLRQKQNGVTHELAKRIMSEANQDRLQLQALTARLFSVTGFETGTPKGAAGPRLRKNRKTSR